MPGEGAVRDLQWLSEHLGSLTFEEGVVTIRARKLFKDDRGKVVSTEELCRAVTFDKDDRAPAAARAGIEQLRRAIG